MSEYVILHDISGSFLLVEKEHNNRQSPLLPSVDQNGNVEDQILEIFVLVTARYKGTSPEIPLAVRRHAYEKDDITLAVVVELLCRRCAVVLRAGYTWAAITPAFIQQIKGAYSPPVWQAISSIGAETLEDASNESVPIFARRGFMKQVTNTIRSRLKECARRSVLSVRQKRVTRNSAVFVIPTREHIIMYYKISTKDCLEALYTQTLARLLPELVLTPFGVNLTDNSFFTEDFEDTIRDGIRERDEEFANKYLMGPSVDAIAEFHQKASKHVEELKQVGMDDTSPRQMRIRLPEFISEMQEMEILTDEGAQIMRKQLPKLYTELDVLTNGKVPVTVCHGDLHEDNLTWPDSVDDKPLLFDWFDSTISHPFFDINSSTFNESPWLDLYVKKWEAYDSLDEIWNLFYTAQFFDRLWTVFRCVSQMARGHHEFGVEYTKQYCRGVLGHFVKRVESMGD